MRVLLTILSIASRVYVCGGPNQTRNATAKHNKTVNTHVTGREVGPGPY